MKRLFLALFLLLASAPAWSHPMPNSAVMLHLHNRDITAQLFLPLIELKLGWGQPISMKPDEVVRDYGPALERYVRAHIHPVAPDGRAWKVVVNGVTPIGEDTPDVRVDLTMTPPAGAPADRLTLGYDVIFHQLITHSAIVSVASDWHNGQLDGAPTPIATLRYDSGPLQIDRSQGSWLRGCAGVFWLGARHIAQGTDHLLFLLALLLPAPLLAAGNRWGGYAGGKTAFWRIVKVASAFTLGHSTTLIFGALGWVHLPATLVESAIALSIFVSVIHALSPIFRGKEVFIAGAFGLVHGLAFASTLTEFGFDAWTMVSSVFAFNLGIEFVQLLVIVAVMPWLVMLAHTRVYPVFRVAGASITGIAAAAWFFERALGWPNPVGPIVEAIAGQAIWLMVGLEVLAIVTTLVSKTRSDEPKVA